MLVTDAFMEAVKADGPWDLVFDGTVYRTVRGARSVEPDHAATYDYAEPGVIFIDRINADEQPGLLRDDRRDQPLRRAAAAALWRLPAGLDQPGAAGGATRSRMAPDLDEDALDELVATAVRMMDNVVDASPLPAAAAGRGGARPSGGSGWASPGWPMRC